MKNKILIVAVLILSTGCASLKYPNWEKVNIETSVENKPCVKTGKKEECTGSREACNPWFKKRATLVNANTVVVHGNSSNERFNGKYFQCHAGLPPYITKFKKEEYGSEPNTVTGQAFLTQKGGGVVTCAGQAVLMYPDTEYFEDIYDDVPSLDALPSEEAAFYKTSQCDAQGNFEFHKVPAGKWVIRTIVRWDVFAVKPFLNSYYTADEVQGGPLKKHVTVQNGEINKFIITE